MGVEEVLPNARGSGKVALRKRARPHPWQDLLIQVADHVLSLELTSGEALCVLVEDQQEEVEGARIEPRPAVEVGTARLVLLLICLFHVPMSTTKQQLDLQDEGDP